MKKFIYEIGLAIIGLAIALMLTGCGGTENPLKYEQISQHLETDQPTGCTHTKHYYLIYNKKETNPLLQIPWPNNNEEKTLCGATLLNLLWTPENNDWRIIMMEQAIVALNNVNSGASTGGGSGYALQDALNILFSFGCNLKNIDVTQAQHDAQKLLDYNTGVIGPGECVETFPGTQQ